VVLTVVLATGWYAVAITLGGEGFFDRQIMVENLNRFVGGSGHSRPVYHYIPYLFSQSLPWSLFLPFVLWDVFKTGLRSGNGALFLKLWFVVMFAFFSISVGKRPVYLLPLYPALALLLAAWFYEAPRAGKIRVGIYRGVAALAVLTGAMLLLISLGDVNWFFAPIEGLLRPKDRDNLMAVRSQLDGFGWTFTIVVMIGAGLWIFLARSLFTGRLRSVAPLLAVISLVHGTIGWSVVMPVIAQAKSYRDFMTQVNERVRPNAQLYLYGEFNSDSVMFYRGAVIEQLEQPAENVARKAGSGDGYLIMTAQSYEKIRALAKNSSQPLLQSVGDGPEGDAPLVLLRANVP
jgi:4-amino-4-deoxy-L-arabinose transferase-like glycosyltransferase